MAKITYMKDGTETGTSRIVVDDFVVDSFDLLASVY